MPSSAHAGATSKFSADLVREDYVPKEDYCSREFAELERKYLWPRIWQLACREEDLPHVGSFVTYDILDESVIIVRTSSTEIKAYNNACLHRGRRLTSGEGRTALLLCKFHGWSWTLDGANKRVVDRDDWGTLLDPESLRLHEFRVGVWAGFVFVNFDENCESFEDYLGGLTGRLSCFEWEKQRYRWYTTVEVEANWKTCQEAFHEAYHVQTTHKILEPITDARASAGYAEGRHGYLARLDGERVIGRYETGPKVHDMRAAYLESLRVNVYDIRAVFTERDYQAACRIMEELPASASYMDAALKAYDFMREAALATGIGYPDITRPQIFTAGSVSTFFPNTSNVIGTPTSGLWYRFRPTPDNNPNRCIFDIYSLERFAPGTEPKVEKQVYKDWRECPNIPPLLLDDFSNIPDVQRGLRTKYFKAARPNPKLEGIIPNMHRALREFIQQGVEAEERARRSID
jgi:phenylpropionate dioxygenase-like ring-hydroxylating dioxygenase large terminal subunit